MSSQKKSVPTNTADNNILVTGGSGMLGSYFVGCRRLGRHELDITQPDRVQNVFRALRPKVVIHLAAATDMAWCENHKNEAHLVNATGTEYVARAAAKAGARLVYISTNAVFDGKKKTPYDEHDLPHPINVYGQTKWEGEEAVKKSGKNALIVRACWLFGGGKSDKRFVGSIARQMDKPSIGVVSDNMGSPTYAKDFAETILTLVNDNATGFYHVANSGCASRLDQAREIAKFFHYNGTIRAARFADFPRGFASLQNESLVSKRLKLRSWQDALSEYLTNEWRTHEKN